MLQKIKMTSYAFILFLVFAFSFIALQVTTEEVEAAPGVCEPVERIRNMKDTARHSDYKVWEERCQVSGSNGQCGNRTEWPAGDGGRCEMITADSNDGLREEDTPTAAGAPPGATHHHDDDGMEHQITDLNRQISELNTQLASISEDHAKEIQSMTDRHLAEISTIHAGHAKAIASLALEQEQEMPPIHDVAPQELAQRHA